MNQIWTCSADHHTGQWLLENAAIKGLTEDRTRSPVHRIRNFLPHGRQPQKALSLGLGRSADLWVASVNVVMGGGPPRRLCATDLAWTKLVKMNPFKRSSRRRALKLSTNPFCCGLPGAI